MNQFFERAITAVDFNLPWILPSLETVESLFPLSMRLLVAASLSLYLAWGRKRDEGSLVRIASS